VSRTEGRDLPEPSRIGGEPHHNLTAISPPSHRHLTAIKDLVVKRGIKLDYNDLPIGAAGGDK